MKDRRWISAAGVAGILTVLFAYLLVFFLVYGMNMYNNNIATSGFGKGGAQNLMEWRNAPPLDIFLHIRFLL